MDNFSTEGTKILVLLGIAALFFFVLRHKKGK